MIENEEQNLTPENAAERLPPPEAEPAGEIAAGKGPEEVSGDELRQLAEKEREAEIKLAWEKKQAGELVKEAFQAHREAGPAMEEFELDIRTGLSVPEVPEVPEKMGQLSEREKEAIRQRRAEAGKQAEGWLFDLAHVNLSEYLHGESNSNAKSAVPNPEYESAAKKMFDAETEMDLVMRGRGRYKKAEDPNAFTNAAVERNLAREAAAAAAGKILAKGDANAWYIWKREYLRDQVVGTLKEVKREKEELLPADEKKLRDLGIDPEALYRSRTKDAAEHAGDKEKKYRLPLRQALSPTARRIAARYVAERDAMNRGLDESASLNGGLEDHEGLWQQAQQEHEKLLAEATAEAKPGTGKRIEFKTPELAASYKAVVNELTRLEKTFLGEQTPDQRQAKYKLNQLIAAKLPNIPGLRLQAMADAKEAAMPKYES
jgi:hypothetical protein